VGVHGSAQREQDSFGAHFPSDVLVGVAVGLASTYLVHRLLTDGGVRLAAARASPAEGTAVGTDRRRRLLARAGLVGGAVALGLFGVLAFAVGFPQSPDGSLLPTGVQLQV
jgi:hypothetical protein